MLRIWYLNSECIIMFYRKEAVTLPDNQDVDFGDTEQSLNYSNPAAMGFQETNYFAMVIKLSTSLE